MTQLSANEKKGQSSFLQPRTVPVLRGKAESGITSPSPCPISPWVWIAYGKVWECFSLGLCLFCFTPSVWIWLHCGQQAPGNRSSPDPCAWCSPCPGPSLHHCKSVEIVFFNAKHGTTLRFFTSDFPLALFLLLNLMLSLCLSCRCWDTSHPVSCPSPKFPILISP